VDDISEKKPVRSSERFDFPSTIEYLIDSPSSSRVHKAVIINISKAGIGAYVFTPHAEGQKIIIQSQLPVACRTAAVRWIKQEDESFYLVGLECVDRPLDS
jgi:hypothetical protein